jgi:hypothetical protein
MRTRQGCSVELEDSLKTSGNITIMVKNICMETQEYTASHID